MIDDLRETRIKKLETLKKAGIEPYPVKTKRTHTIEQALAGFEDFSKSKKKTTLAGRIRSIREQGALTFLHFEDGTGKIQALLKEEGIGNKKYQFFLDNFDIGDFIEVSGALFETKRGEKTIEVSDFQILAKSLLPLPEKWHGLKDIELRLRQRYLDLIMDPEEREIFEKKAIFWKSIREFLEKEGFMEVDTQALEEIPGGADANPFKTHHDALDTDFYLRISLELPLKKFIISGFEKVYEIGKVFRNEGIDAEHLQDYLIMEFYWAYADYEMLMDFVEKMYKFIVKNTTGNLETSCQGKKVDWSKKWDRVDYFEIFKKKTGLDLNKVSKEDLFNYTLKAGLTPDKNLGRGRLIDFIFKHQIRSDLVEPCFLINPPSELVPLAKRDPKNPKQVQRMQPVACGTELGNGYSELNDPIDQKERFGEQMKLRQAGDKEAQMIDKDFITALEYGMPPTAGFGLSERFFAVLMDRPIREIVFQPPMRSR